MSHDSHETNRQTWNEMTDIHFDHPDYKVKEFLEGETNLKEIELKALGDVSGKKLLHLMCHFGKDTLCWARRGAIVTGADISDRSIELANKLKKMAALEGTFIRSDVIDLISKIDGQFDFVFQSHGTLCWLADLRPWAKTIAHYLKPGGMFFIVDSHPIYTLFQDDEFSYLQKEPVVFKNDTDYCDREHILKGDQIEYQHPLGRIINALVEAGLVIEELGEYDKGFYGVEENWVQTDDGYWYPPDGPPRYPIMFSLKVRKPG